MVPLKTGVIVEPATRRLFAEHQWAVVDRLMTEDWAEHQLGPFFKSLKPLGFVEDEPALPLLGPITEAHAEDWARWSGVMEDQVAQGVWPLFCALLQTEASELEIRGHLTQQMLLKGEGADRYLLRWHDPRVLMHLLWVLTPTQSDQLFGPIKTWTLSIDGVWHSLRLQRVTGGTTAQTESGLNRRPSVPLKLSARQLNQLNDIALIGQVMTATGLPLLKASMYGPAISDLLDQARTQFGQIEEDDLIAYAQDAVIANGPQQGAENQSIAATHHTAKQLLNSGTVGSYQRAKAHVFTESDRTADRIALTL